MRPLAAAFLLPLLVPAGVHAAAEALQNSASPFLQAHQQSQVKWLPWGREAFDRAAAENRPIFLAVGTASSELSGAMNRQTFSNPDVAAFLNEHFVCVLVDREEYPAVAAQGQAYVRAVKQLSGWPLNLWLTPELKPFEGATYLPPSEEWGKEGFLNVAQRAASTWESSPEMAREEAENAVALTEEFETPLPAEPFRVGDVRTSLEGAASAWTSQSDDDRGGFNETPRHPEPEMLRFLLLSGDEAGEAALDNLRALLASALRDPLDGGFFRYTADASARLPYFQKRLSDQARMSLALLDAARVSSDPTFGLAARATLDYVLARLALPDGGFAAGEDATAAGASQYYVWTFDQLQKELGSADAARLAEAFGAEEKGNVPAEDDPSQAFLGQNILAGAPDPVFGEALARLRTARDRRDAPDREETVVAHEQALILLALARAGRELDEPRYTEAARRTAAFIERTFVTTPAGDLRRMQGSDAPAGPTDHAAVALALRAVEDEDQRRLADQVIRRGDELFLDEAGHLYTTPAELPPGIWFRLVAPLSHPGDSPAAGPLRLIAGEPFTQQLAAVLATQHRDPTLAASGDLLLALRLYLNRLP